MKDPGYCVECFIKIKEGNMCNRCIAEKSGDLDYLKEENSGSKKND